MKTYWELPRIEQIKLSDEQFETYKAIEVMSLGLVKPMEPVYDKVPTPAVETETMYVLSNGYSDLCAVRTLEEAKKIMAIQVYEETYDYACGQDHKYVRAVALSVKERQYVTNYPVVREALAQAKIVQRHNNELLNIYTDQQKAWETGLAKIINDREECRRLAWELERITTTYQEYCGIAGDSDIAKEFLSKAYPEHMIELWTSSLA